MGTSTARKAAARRNRGALDATSKKPRITWVDVILDGEVADAYDVAEKDLLAAEERLSASRPRRLAAARNALPTGATPEEQAAAAAAVVAADDLEVDALREARDAAAEALALATRRYKFRALGRARWESLKAEHPPQESDHEDVREASGKKDAEAEYHFDTLAPALIQEASISPRLSEEDVDEIFNGGDWNGPEIVALWQTALVAQATARANPAARQ